MQQYIGTKLINAEPIKQGNFYAKYHPDDIVPQSINWSEEDGYAVQYEDGYISWSPKKIFEESYLELTTNKELRTDAPSISQKMVDDFILDTRVMTQLGKITIVTVILKNGFTIVESSACVSQENYDESIGYAICLAKIKNQVWNHLGFILQSAVTKLL